MGLFTKKVCTNSYSYMGHLLTRYPKKKERVPDLSRYNYQPSNNYENLSSDAASTALRTHSLTSNSYNPQKYYSQTNSRTNSLTSNTSYGGFRSNSLTNNSYNYQHRNSLTSRGNSSRANSLLSSSYNPRHSLPNRFPQQQQNPIIIHTTRTTDEYGRTKSITTETIQKFGQFEVVKTETHDELLLQPPALSKFNRTSNVSYAGSLLSNELGSIAEDEEFTSSSAAAALQLQQQQQLNNTYNTLTTKEKKRMTMILEPEDEDQLAEEGEQFVDTHNSNPKKSILKKTVSISPKPDNYEVLSVKETNFEKDENKKVNNAGLGITDDYFNGVVDEDISDDGSVYSDAFDKMPWERKQRQKKKVQVIDTNGNNSRRSSLTRNSISNYPRSGVPKTKKEPMSQEEMMARAMEIARQKVYGAQNADSVKPNGSGFRSHTLRDNIAKQSQQPYTPPISTVVGDTHGNNASSSSAIITNSPVKKKKKKFSFKGLFKSSKK